MKSDDHKCRVANWLPSFGGASSSVDGEGLPHHLRLPHKPVRMTSRAWATGKILAPESTAHFTMSSKKSGVHP